MSNLWDALPFPITADDDAARTYEAVGVTMSAWEGVEFEFARLYSVFSQDRDGESVREYGNPIIFRDRIGSFAIKARAFFVRFPSQANEGTLTRLVESAIGFSARRNDIAHGIVMDVSGIAHFMSLMPRLKSDVPQHLLVPPYHVLRRHVDGFPLYGYNSDQIRTTAGLFVGLRNAVERFRKLPL